MNSVLKKLDQHRKNRLRELRPSHHLLIAKIGLSVGGLLSTILSVTPAWAADRVAFSYFPFGDFSISASDLETFTKEGKVTPDFAFYAKRATPQQLHNCAMCYKDD